MVVGRPASGMFVANIRMSMVFLVDKGLYVVPSAMFLCVTSYNVSGVERPKIYCLYFLLVYNETY